MRSPHGRVGVCMRGFVTFRYFFFFNDTATTEIYTLSLHDALPISLKSSPTSSRVRSRPSALSPNRKRMTFSSRGLRGEGDRKSTRLNSSHANISYAVFCLKKKNSRGFADNEFVPAIAARAGRNART